MERQRLFNSIEERLNILALRISTRGKLNLLELNIHAENFYAELLNLVFGWNLKNLNASQQNFEAIDLQDDTQKILIQVSSTSTKAKIESSLTKDLSAKNGWQFYFLSIARDAADLRNLSYSNPHSLIFSPSTDIYDVISILRKIQSVGINQLIAIEAFLRKEFPLVDSNRIDTGLAAVIQILANENLTLPTPEATNPFSIDSKITVNELQGEGKRAIEEHAIHHPRVQKIYTEYDKQGVNRSLAILTKIGQIYASKKAILKGDALFTAIVADVIAVIQSSANYQAMHQEELELYTHILVVDAFVRCKIFEKPSGDNSAFT